MITDEQREERKKGIFSSDVPRIMAGDSVRVALEKMGEIEPADLSDLEYIELGNIVEPRILDAFESKEGVKLMRSPDTRRHHEHVWLGAHLDAIDFQRSVVECKSVGWYNRDQWGEPGTDEVPDRVLWQVQEQMAVARLPVAKVPVCFLTQEALVAIATGRPIPIEIYIVPADRDLEAYIVERCGKVWRHIEERTLPAPESPLDARLIYRKDSGAVVEADEQTVELHHQLMNVKADAKILKDREERLAGMLQLAMKEASELRHNGVTLATWKLNKGRKGYAVEAKEPFREFRPKEIQP